MCRNTCGGRVLKATGTWVSGPIKWDPYLYLACSPYRQHSCEWIEPSVDQSSAVASSCFTAWLYILSRFLCLGAVICSEIPVCLLLSWSTVECSNRAPQAMYLTSLGAAALIFVSLLTQLPSLSHAAVRSFENAQLNTVHRVTMPCTKQCHLFQQYFSCWYSVCWHPFYISFLSEIYAMYWRNWQYAVELTVLSHHHHFCH